MMTNSHHTVLYTGVTGNIEARGWQHKSRLVKSFTKRYNVTKMIYAECYDNVHEAIAREKQIKGWKRKKKEQLINKVNPDWKDIYEESFS
jgi:putative endonuclease